MDPQARLKLRRALAVVVFFAIIIGIAASQMQKGGAAPGDAVFRQQFMAEQKAARAALNDKAAETPAAFTDRFRRVLATALSFTAGDAASVTDGRLFFTADGWDKFTASLHQARYVSPHDEPYADINFEVTQGPAQYQPVIDDKYKNLPHLAVLATQKLKNQKLQQFCTFVLEPDASGKPLPDTIHIESVVCVRAD